MIETHKTKANLGIGIGFPAQLASLLINTFALLPEDVSNHTPLSVFASILSLGGTATMIWGCWHYAKAKGYSGAWGFLALLSLVGLIVLVGLRDRTPGGTAPWWDFRGRRGSVLASRTYRDQKEPVLALHDVDFSYGMVQALRGINMKFRPGEVTCVIGRNGVGKTTLMQTIMGLHGAANGSLMLGEHEVRNLSANERAKAGIALVPQGRQIFPKLTVEENLRVGLQARTDGLKTIPEEIYELFPVLKEMAHRNGGDLSGGQQQQLAIGRALAGDPKVLLLDEPTEGIQPNVIQQIGHVLRKLVTERKMTVVLVEQYLDFVKEFGHAFYVMNRGKVVAQGATAELTEEVIEEHLHV